MPPLPHLWDDLKSLKAAVTGAAAAPASTVMRSLIQETDWAATPLGPLSAWPQSLRSVLSLCLGAPFPASIIWGPSQVQLYNDAYRRFVGLRHPALLGAVFTESFPEVSWPFLKAMGGETHYKEDQELFLLRDGALRETFVTGAFSPIAAEDGGVGGVYHTITDTTQHVIGRRRANALQALAMGVAQARGEAEIVAAAGAALAGHQKDVPFLLFYLPDHAVEDGYRLAGALGLPEGLAASPAMLGPDGPWPTEAPPGGRVCAAIDQLLPAGACGPYPEPPSKALAVHPALGGAAGRPALLLVAGLSARLELDEAYRDFIATIAETVGAALANARAQAEQRRAAEALHELNTAKSRLFANVSHEFRTPLTLMLGPVEDALREGGALLPPAQRERLEIIQRNSHRLLKLVNLLLTFSRVEAGQVQAVFEPVDLAAQTAELAGSFQAVFRRAGLELRIDCPPLSMPVLVDRDMWEKIVLNLVSNAFKFTRAGHVAVELRECGGRVRLSVRDTGAGIGPDHVPHVFERFYRAETQGGRTQEGTGIGLALVSDLVKLHGGEVAVESKAGVGSSFHVSLPMAGPAHPQAGMPPFTAVPTRAGDFAEEALRWLPQAGEGLEAPDAVSAAAEACRIVLADDNHDMRSYVAGILTEAGYAVEACANGAQALEAVRRGAPPDLLLTDVMMPDLGGLELLRRLRADAATQGVLVILLSAAASEESRVAGIAAGADDYLVKPFSARELRARIDGAVQLARVRRAAAAREQELMLQLAEHEAKTALQQSEDQLAFALHAGRLGAWSFELATSRFTCSDICREGLGLGPGDRLESHADLMERLLPQDVLLQRPLVQRAVERRELLDLEYRVRKPDGSIAWIEVRGRASYADDGRPLRLTGVSMDITPRKLADQRQQALMAELNHRVKNTLATVQSIALQTRRRADSVEEFADKLTARIGALARVHDMLVVAAWDGARLGEVVRSALGQVVTGHDEPGGWSVDGPGIWLNPNAAVTMAMVFHELAGNAARHGALSVPGGHVSVGWEIGDGGADILWRESRGPAVPPVVRRGFGSRLVEQGVRTELGGSAELAYQPDGLIYRLRLPFSAKVRPAQ